MRVLHILNELRPSGAETMLRAAAAFWRARGIDSEILITGETAGDYARMLEQAGYALHHLPFRRSPLYLARVFRFLLEHHYDTVHIHCERANFWYALLAYGAGRRRIVRSVHGLFQFGGLLRWRRLAQRYVLRTFLNVKTVAVSPAVQRVEWDTYGNPALSIPNWFDSERFRPPGEAERTAARRKLGIAPGTLAVVTVGNCSPVKNHAAVIEALAAMPRKLKIVYLHAGCEEATQSDRQLASRTGVLDRVRFLGAVEDVAEVLHAADMFLMPSLHEGLGIAAVEALGAGLPAALADTEGLRELRAIAPECEWIRPEADAVAGAILRLGARTAVDRVRLSERIHSRFGIGVGASQYAELYTGGSL